LRIRFLKGTFTRRVIPSANTVGKAGHQLADRLSHPAASAVAGHRLASELLTRAKTVLGISRQAIQFDGQAPDGELCAVPIGTRQIP
jgi:hypothetical protein